MSNFDKCFSIVVNEEGAYVNNPRDNGGPTKYGITLKTLTAWRYPEVVTKEDVEWLDIEEAKNIYRSWYWYSTKCDKLPFIAALMLFDAAVNSGPKQAIKWFQRAVGSFQDGVMGPKTLKAWKSRVKRSETVETLSRFGSYRLMLMKNHEDFDVMGYGWFSRVVEIAIRSGQNASDDSVSLKDTTTKNR